MKERFFADSMLGRLALWMRIIGYDVEYEKNMQDGELVRRALKEGRIMLTRDAVLIKRRELKGRCFFIKSDYFREQLKEVLSAFYIDRGLFLTRCVRCNRTLEKAQKESIKERVPPYVYSTQERFSICPMCNRVYWPGTHAGGMERELKAIEKE